MTWCAPNVERPQPLFIADSRQSSDSWLDYHRAILLWKCAGLTAAQLATRPVSTSALSLLGLVRRMAENESGHALHERFVYGTQGRPERDLRWVYAHMIEEYARHNGHADLIRELIDGSTGR